MTGEEIPKDASLLRCTVKKSASILKKVVLYGSYVVVAVAVLVCAGWLAWNGFNAVLPVLNQMWLFLVSVSWYVYAGVVAISAIPIYSLVWCIARELTDEDWQSDLAETLAIALAIALALALAIAIALALALAIALAIALALALANDSKVFLFIGAYLHYRKRIREAQKRGGA